MRTKDGSTHRIWYDEPTIWAKEQNSRVEKECKFLDKLFKKYKVKKVLDVGSGVGSHCGRLKELLLWGGHFIPQSTENVTKP